MTIKYIYHTTLEDELYHFLKNNIKKKIPHNNLLAGNIKEEYLIDDLIPKVEPFLLKNISNSEDLMNYFKAMNYLSEDRPMYLDHLWVNFMKKHEFNPLHTHKGIFSFVIFMEMPFLYSEQVNVGPGKTSNAPKAGCLEFIHIDELGKLQNITLGVDKTWEKKCLIFPADLNHLVYPFYKTNKYRITISGNFKFKV
tara:strand:- start:778 stop:1365 length:588 start_codon:yes stop_codon:yes gene_type:complete